MQTKIITYHHGDTKCLGFSAYTEKGAAKRPLVLVAHAIRGQDDFAKDKAKMLAGLGYVAFAIDMYGEGKTAVGDEATELMAPFFLDRHFLQGRIRAALDCARQLPHVDPEHVGAIGFCFGGMCVYELLRSGAPLSGVVCFHGVFATEREGQKAKMVPLARGITGKLLILHGYLDPLVEPEELEAVQDEMTQAGVDWQVHTYGQARHAFTNPMANAPEKGTVYNSVASKRAFQTMELFFEATLY